MKAVLAVDCRADRTMAGVRLSLHHRFADGETVEVRTSTGYVFVGEVEGAAILIADARLEDLGGEVRIRRRLP